MKSPFTRRLIIVSYLVAVLLVMAHSINAFVEHELATTLGSDPILPALSDAAPASTETSMELAARIKESGLFQVSMRPLGSPGSAAKAAPPTPPLEVAKKLRLLGTIVSDREGGGAIIEELGSKRQGLFHLHDTIPDIGEIQEIRRDGVMIGLNDQKELLLPAVLQTEESRLLPTSMPASQQAFAPLLKRTLDRREVMEAVSDPTKLMMQAHAIPYFTNGTLNGFRLDFINPRGFFDKAGFQYGDVIQRINGVEIRDPGRLLGMFNQVANERTVKVDIVRAMQNTTLTYELR